MRICYLLAAALALGMLPGRAAANEDDQNQNVTAGQDPAAGSVECSQCKCGAGGAATMGSGEYECSQCPCQQPPSTGGAGATLGAPGETNVTVISGEEGAKAREKSPNEGISLAVGSGVEGYTSSLAPRIELGWTYGLTLTAQPTKIVGLELGYSGANNRVEDVTTPGNLRIIRNSGIADIKFSLLPRAVEPFLFGGIGINRATIRNNFTGSGYQPDTFGSVPVGGGVNFHIAQHFLASARASYDWLFSRDYTPPTPGNKFGISSAQFGDIWRASLNLGGTF